MVRFQMILIKRGSNAARHSVLCSLASMTEQIGPIVAVAAERAPEKWQTPSDGAKTNDGLCEHQMQENAHGHSAEGDHRKHRCLEPKVPRGQKVRGKYVSRAALNKRHTTWPPPLKLTATPSSLMQLSAAERDPSETCSSVLLS